MTQSTDTGTTFMDEIECFGEFNPEKTVCKKLCAFSIRCAIEKDQNVKMEILDDLVSNDMMPMKMQ